MGKESLKEVINRIALLNNWVAKSVAKVVQPVIWKKNLKRFGTPLSQLKTGQVINGVLHCIILYLLMHHNNALVCGEKTLGLFSKLLAICDEPEWAVTNENFYKILEYMLWDAFKKGISLHLAECSKCVFIDLDIMLALLSKAIG